MPEGHTMAEHVSEEVQDQAIPDALKDIWIAHGLPEHFLSYLKLRGDTETAVPSSFRLGLAAQITIGLAGLAAAYVHYLRTGVVQSVTVDARHAVLSFHSEAWYTIDNTLPGGSLWDNIAGLYKTKDGGWVRIHTNFPHHRAGVLAVLNIPDTPVLANKSDVVRAIEKWDGQALEDECAKRGMCVFKLRGLEEWENSPHGKALNDTKAPVVEITKVAEAKRKADGRDSRNGGLRWPLEGFKVLDLSRVLAGPVAGRNLSAHGAQVLLITSPQLPSLPHLDVETSLGKRTTQLDLSSTSNENVRELENLVRDADVFLQAYRPGGVEEKGFGVDNVVRMKPGVERGGVVYASLRAWGWNGPWANRRGFDSLVQTATGFNMDEGKAFQAFKASQGEETEWKPRPLPMQAIDHASGYFLAFGINVAIARMIIDGGSHEVRVSLAGVGRWIRSLGRIDPAEAFGPGSREFPPRKWPLEGEVAELSAKWMERRGIDGGQGRTMTALRQAALLGITPAREGVLIGEALDWGAPMRLDADDPVWL